MVTLVGERTWPDVSPDAVVVVPGVMGSTLESDRGVLWGTNKLRWYASAWTETVSALDELALTPEERGGRYGRIRATGLLKRPGWAPFLQGIEPYGDLVNGIRRVMVHGDAVMEFAYDWRLPVAYNARLLAETARTHLERWRRHPEYQRFRRDRPNARAGRLVMVAHSMGGLLLRGLEVDGLDIRASVTLGTPFQGSAKAALILGTGRGAPVPFPREKMRRFAATLPGLYDLLPTYRCVGVPDPWADARSLTPQDVEGLGGDRELAAQSADWHAATCARRLPGHFAVMGVEQPTNCSLSLSGGTVAGEPYTYNPTADGLERDAAGLLVRYPGFGDGTVPTSSAEPNGLRAAALAQQHGPIANFPEAVTMVNAVLCGGDIDRPRLGGGDVGLVVPDLVSVGATLEVWVTNVAGPVDAKVRIFDDTESLVDQPPLNRAGNGLIARSTLPRSGVFRVEVAGSGNSPVTQRVLATPA